jgi:hypothetical protein
MSKRITLSVQDALHAEMEKWKGELNFSRVFQDAIREKIERKENFQKRLDSGGFDMEATVERLRAERDEGEEILFDEGKNDGLEWAKYSHYSSLKDALEWDPTNGEVPDQADLREEIQDMIHDDEHLGFEANSWEMDDVTTKWAKGWVEGVQEFWSQVEGKL